MPSFRLYAGLHYRIKDPWSATFEGVSHSNGLGERFVAKVKGEVIHILVRKQDGSWKQVLETTARNGEVLITLRSHKIRVKTRMEPHPKTQDGLPVEDAPPQAHTEPTPAPAQKTASVPTPVPTPTSAKKSALAKKPSQKPLGTPNKATGKTQHPVAPGQSDAGTKVKQGTTPNGVPVTNVSHDLPDLQKYFSLYTNAPITESDFNDAAKEIGCEVALIKAVKRIEAPMGSFDKYHRPTILYERQVFSRCSHQKFEASNADISSEKAYTTAKVDKYKHPIPENDRYSNLSFKRFERAFLLDESAAIQACSWGAFQVLGEGYEMLGFHTPQDLLKVACTSERSHLLKLFVPFVKWKNLAPAFIKKDWGTIACAYNGKKYRKFKYDEKLKDAYEKEKEKLKNN